MIIFLILMKAHSIIFNCKLDVSRVVFCLLLLEQLIISNTFHLIKAFDIICKTWMIQKVPIQHCQHSYTAPIPIHSLHQSGPSTIPYKKTYHNPWKSLKYKCFGFAGVPSMEYVTTLIKHYIKRIILFHYENFVIWHSFLSPTHSSY